MIKECATPQKLTYNLFKIEDFKPETPPDTKLRSQISSQDPYLARKLHYSRLHPSVKNTEDLVRKLEPGGSRHKTDKDALAEIIDLDQRFA